MQPILGQTSPLLAPASSPRTLIKLAIFTWKVEKMLILETVRQKEKPRALGGGGCKIPILILSLISCVRS